MQRVLVTRPQPSATRTAEKLSALGYQPRVLPLTRIEPVPLQAMPNPGAHDAVAITSANAVRHAPAALLDRLADLPAYPVGEKTGEAAREAGLTIAGTGSGDANGLLRRIAAEHSSGLRILVLCGRVRRETFESGLEAAGFHPTILETYDTVSLSPSGIDIAKALEDQPVEAVLLYSALAAKACVRLVERGPTAALFSNARFIAISPRVARYLPQSASVHVAAEPTEESMFSLLAKTK